MKILEDKLPTSLTKYLNIPIGPEGRLFLDVQWKDATSSATITLETTGTPASDAPVDLAGSSWVWKNESGVTITGPAASAAGSTKVHVSNLCGLRARLKIVTAAICDFVIYTETS